MGIPDITRVHSFIAESTHHFDGGGGQHGGGRSRSDSDADLRMDETADGGAALGEHLFLSSSSFELCMEQVDDEMHSCTIMQQPRTESVNDMNASVMYCSAIEGGGRVSVRFDLVESKKSFHFSSRGLPQLDSGSLDMSKVESDPWLRDRRPTALTPHHPLMIRSAVDRGDCRDDDLENEWGEYRERLEERYLPTIAEERSWRQ